MKRRRSIIATAVLTVCATLALPLRADTTDKPWWVPRLRDNQVAPTDADKSGEKAAPTAKPAPSAGTTTGAPAAAAAAPAEAASATTDTPPAPAKTGSIILGATSDATTQATVAPSDATPPPPPLPSSSLLKSCAMLRKSSIGNEANAVAYLGLIETGKASAAQVNDFAAYLAKKGAVQVALQFQQYATQLAPNDPTVWSNLGSMQRTAGHLGAAESAFKKAIALDPTDALAHYNLGATYDSDKDYDNAIEEYRRALILDPGLADPSKNPQVVNNENLLAVELTIYQNQSGALGLPLLQMQKPAEPAKPDAPKTKAPEKK